MTPVTRGMVRWARSQSLAVRLLLGGVLLLASLVLFVASSYGAFWLWGRFDWMRAWLVVGVAALVIAACCIAAGLQVARTFRVFDRDRRDQ